MHEVQTTAKDSAAPAEAATDAEAVTEEAASAPDGWARAELDEILLREQGAASAAAVHRTPRRASRSSARHSATKPSTTARKRTATTVKPKTPSKTAPKTSTAAKKPSSSASAAPSSGNAQSGTASWYEAAPSGTCAHKTLPKGTTVTVTNVATGKQTSCVVSDRGPYVDGYIIDLSKSNFSALAPLSDGIIQVRITW